MPREWYNWPCKQCVHYLNDPYDILWVFDDVLTWASWHSPRPSHKPKAPPKDDSHEVNDALTKSVLVSLTVELGTKSIMLVFSALDDKMANHSIRNHLNQSVKYYLFHFLDCFALTLVVEHGWGQSERVTPLNMLTIVDEG